MLERLQLFQTISGMKLKIFLPYEKPEKAIGLLINPYRKVFDGIVSVLRTDSLSMEIVSLRI